MTTEEKLQHFMDTSLAAARSESNQLLTAHKEAMDKLYEEHVATKQRQAQLQLVMEEKNMEKERNKRLSAEQLKLKHETNKRLYELKETLFAEVRMKLSDFMTTEDYRRLLLKQIQDIKAFAGDSNYTIYLDPADELLKFELERTTGIPLTLSAYSFSGGTRAVLADRNILIDHSFESKLAGLKDHYTFIMEEN